MKKLLLCASIFVFSGMTAQGLRIVNTTDQEVEVGVDYSGSGFVFDMGSSHIKDIKPQDVKLEVYFRKGRGPGLATCKDIENPFPKTVFLRYDKSTKKYSCTVS